MWNTSKEGDYVGFYVTSPWKKLIGFGKFGRKFVDSRIVWPDERLFERSIWKYRIRIEPIFVSDDWKNGISVPSTIVLNTGRKVLPKQTFQELVKQADKKWKSKIYLGLKSS